MKERNWRKKKLIPPKVRETSRLPNYEIKMSMVLLVVAYLQWGQEVVCVAGRVYVGVCGSYQGSFLIIFDHWDRVFHWAWSEATVVKPRSFSYRCPSQDGGYRCTCDPTLLSHDRWALKHMSCLHSQHSYILSHVFSLAEYCNTARKKS